MARKEEITQHMLGVIPDTLLWIDGEGYLLDYHPNNHSYLFNRQDGVLGCHLEEVFNHDLSVQMLDLTRECKKQNKQQ